MDITTHEQIAAAGDPRVALAAAKMDEAKMLRTVLTTMLLHDGCRKLFKEVWSNGFAVGEYTHCGTDEKVLRDIEDWVRTFREELLAESDELREMMEDLVTSI